VKKNRDLNTGDEKDNTQQVQKLEHLNFCYLLFTLLLAGRLYHANLVAESRQRRKFCS
jgi:hypothetical protein